VADELVFDGLADCSEDSAVLAPEGSPSLVAWHYFVVVVQLGPVVDLVVVLRNLVHVGRVVGLQLGEAIEHLGRTLKVAEVRDHDGDFGEG
jgi:hypothetical protein